MLKYRSNATRILVNYNNKRSSSSNNPRRCCRRELLLAATKTEGVVAAVWQYNPQHLDSNHTTSRQCFHHLTRKQQRLLPPSSSGDKVFVASYSSTATAAKVLSDTAAKAPDKQEDGNVLNRPDFKYLDTTFSDSEEAYKSKTVGELFRALFVFRMTSFETLVNNNDKILKLLRKVLGRRLFTSLMKRTFYGQFVAGADVDEIAAVIAKNYRHGVKSILDYSVEEDMPEDKAKQKTKDAFQHSQENGANAADAKGQYSFHEQFGDRRKNVTSARTYFYDSEGQCDKNMWTFMKCVDVVSEATEGTGLAAIKLTALGRPQFLLQMSHVLIAMKEIFDKLTSEETDEVLKRIKADTLEAKLYDLGIPVSRDETKQWFTWLDISENKEIDLYSWSSLMNPDQSVGRIFTVPNLEKGALESKFPHLSSQQEGELRNMFKRINNIVEHAAERNVRLMVDAEQTYFQPAISRLTMEMMRKFNKETPIVFNTYQCYLKNTHTYFAIDLDLAKRENFTFGCKVVRGAYMEQERHRAASIGYADPINDDFEATNAMYERVIDAALQEITVRGKGQVAVMAATHNEDTIRYCVQRLKDYGLRREDKALCFGQLLGMCDHLTFPLGQSGYSVYKYVPYGPVEEVLPYLTRRAAENRGILAKVQKERRMLLSEVKRRISPFSSRS